MFKAKAGLERWGKEEDSGKRSRGRHVTEEVGRSSERQRKSRPFWNTGKNAIDSSLQIRGFSLSGHSVLHRNFGLALVPFACHYFCLRALFSVLIICCQERSTTSLTAPGEESTKCALSELLLIQSAPIPRPGEPLHCSGLETSGRPGNPTQWKFYTLSLLQLLSSLAE